jgi:hypothetical protein
VFSSTGPCYNITLPLKCSAWQMTNIKKFTYRIYLNLKQLKSKTPPKKNTSAKGKCIYQNLRKHPPKIKHYLEKIFHWEEQ